MLECMSTKWSTEILGKNGAPDFSALLKDECVVILLRGKNIFNDFIYCYLKIAYPDIPRLQAAIAGEGNFNISDFGTVLAAGKGEPPEEVKAELALSYPMLDKPTPFGDHSNTPAAPTEKKNWDEY